MKFYSEILIECDSRLPNCSNSSPSRSVKFCWNLYAYKICRIKKIYARVYITWYLKREDLQFYFCAHKNCNSHKISGIINISQELFAFVRNPPLRIANRPNFTCWYNSHHAAEFATTDRSNFTRHCNWFHRVSRFVHLIASNRDMYLRAVT